MKKKTVILAAACLALLCIAVLPVSALEPNDPYYQNGSLWYIPDIDAPGAWDITTGGDIIVAVLDSGLDITNPDFTDNLWTNTKEIPDNGIDDDGNGYIDDIHGWNFYENCPVIADYFSHGTIVSGTLGAKGDNGIGITGVCWNVRLMPLKISEPTMGISNGSSTIAAIRYAVDNGARIISCSNGGGDEASFEKSAEVLKAIQYAEDHGVLFITGAGNTPQDNDAIPTLFSCYNPKVGNMIVVSATDRNSSLADFSSYGKKTSDLAAPGVEFLAPSIVVASNTANIINNEVVFPSGSATGDAENWVRESIAGMDDGDMLTGLTDESDPLSQIIKLYMQFGIPHKIEGAKTSAIGSDKPFIRGDSEQAVYLTLVGNYSIPTDEKSGITLVLTKKPLSSYATADELLDDLAKKNGVYQIGTTLKGTFTESETAMNDPTTQLKMTFFAPVTAEEFRKTYGDEPLYLGLIYASTAENGFLDLNKVLIASDYRVTEQTYSNPVVTYGTSESAPLVSGVAALVWSANPDLSYKQVKEAILSTVDKVPALADKVATGGKLNASAAVRKALAMKGEKTAQTPAPFIGLIAGLGVAAVLLRLRT